MALQLCYGVIRAKAQIKKQEDLIMGLDKLVGWVKHSPDAVSSCGAADKPAACGAADKPAACGAADKPAACGAADKPAACGAADKPTACGAPDKK